MLTADDGMQDLCCKVYFDTDVWRRIGPALSGNTLSAEIRRRIVLSPISLLEVLSQLALHKGDMVLRQVQSVNNWVKSGHSEILPWPNVAIAHFGFDVSLPDNSFEVAERNLSIWSLSGEKSCESTQRIS